VAGTPRLINDWRERLWRYAAGGSVALTAYAFFEMVRWFTRSAS
jgi:hypothetical protein